MAFRGTGRVIEGNVLSHSAAALMDCCASRRRDAPRLAFRGARMPTWSENLSSPTELWTRYTQRRLSGRQSGSLVPMDELIAQIREQAAARERQFADILGEMAEKQRAGCETWGEDARKAWDEGGMFYQPVFPAHSFSQSETPRAESAEKVLEAITAAGWKLHTWAVMMSPQGLTSAHPLFVREDIPR